MQHKKCYTKRVIMMSTSNMCHNSGGTLNFLYSYFKKHDKVRAIFYIIKIMTVYAAMHRKREN